MNLLNLIYTSLDRRSVGCSSTWIWLKQMLKVNYLLSFYYNFWVLSEVLKAEQAPSYTMGCTEDEGKFKYLSTCSSASLLPRHQSVLQMHLPFLPLPIPFIWSKAEVHIFMKTFYLFFPSFYWSLGRKFSLLIIIVSSLTRGDILVWWNYLWNRVKEMM